MSTFKFATVKSPMKSIISCALVAAFLGSLSATAAAGPVQAPSLTDLDLTQSAGVATAYARIRAAARRACEPPDFDIRVLGAMARVNRCTEQAIARLVADADVPALTAYYQGRTGQQVAVAWQR